MKKLRLLLSVMLILALLGGCAGQEPAEETAAPTETEVPAGTEESSPNYAPDFTVVDGEGNEVHLSDFVGKPIVLNFWASWCGPCKSEMPDFNEAYQEYGDEIHFVMVNLAEGTRETVDTAKEFLSGTDYTFPVYFDTASDAANTYGIYSIPNTYFIDADGVLVAYAAQAIDAETLQKGIDMILE